MENIYLGNPTGTYSCPVCGHIHTGERFDFLKGICKETVND